MPLFFICNCINAQVKIGNNPLVISSNSLLELESTSKGLLLPRLTNAQMTGMANPPKGMFVFNTTDSSLYIRRDAGWAIVSAGVPPVWGINGNNIYNTNTDFIGIGTASPGCKLDLRNVPIGFSSATKRWEMAYDSANAYFYIDEYGAARRFVIEDGGYVGIGITQPKFDLHIDNASVSTGIKLTNSVTGNSSIDGTDITQAGNNLAIINWEDDGYIFFNTRHLQRVAIDPAGNVGIGTSSPAAKLDVNGTANINGALTITDGTQGDGKVLTSDGSGRASWKDAPAKQIYFEASLKNSSFIFNAGFGTALIMDTLLRNDGNTFDMSTSTFTAPSSGLYHFFCQVQWGTAFNDSYIMLCVNGAIYNDRSRWSRRNNVNYSETQSTEASILLSAGETLQFKVAESTSGSVTIIPFQQMSYLQGYKIY